MTDKYDLVFGIGPACRPAYYLELTKIRKCAYPFDWIGTNLEIILNLFKTDFESFLNSYEDISEEWCIPGLRNIRDNNGIVIPHHIKRDEPISIAVTNFRELMFKRYKRLKTNISKAKNIAIITNQKVKRKILRAFLLEFSNLFPNKNITLINIYACKNRNNKDEIILNKNLRIFEYYFNDINKNGDNHEINPQAWLGNEEKWLSIMQDL